MKGTHKEITAFSFKALFFAHSGPASPLVDLWECSTGRRLFQFHPPSDSHQHVTSIAFNHNSKTVVLAVGYSSGEVVLINARTAEPFWQFRTPISNTLSIGHSGCIHSLTFSHTGNVLYTAGDDNKIVKWNFDAKKQEMAWNTTKSGKKQAPASILSVTPTNQYLLGAVKSTVKVWDLRTEKATCVKLIKGHTEEIEGLTCDPSGRYVATFSQNDSYINIWDLEDEEKTLVTPKFRVNTSLELNGLQLFKPKKSVGVLLASSKAQVQLYRVKFAQEEEKTLKVNGIIKDEGKAIVACEFVGKTQIMMGFNLPHGCSFKAVGYISEEGKMVKEQTMNSKVEFGATKAGKTKTTESYQQMINQATVINLAEANPVAAVTSVVPPSIYKGKLVPLIKTAKGEAKLEKGKSSAAIGSALVQSLKSGDQSNLDWALNQNDLEIIENTVQTLASEYTPQLLRAIIFKLEQKQQDQQFTEALYKWLQAVFKFKAADLVMERGALGSLAGIFKAVEDRTANFEKLVMLKGKLELLLQLGTSEKKGVKGETKYEAIKVLDENQEEEVEGIEVINIKDLKSTAEMMEEEEEGEKKMESEEELPDVVEEMQDEQEEDIQLEDKSEEDQE